MTNDQDLIVRNNVVQNTIGQMPMATKFITKLDEILLLQNSVG